MHTPVYLSFNPRSRSYVCSVRIYLVLDLDLHMKVLALNNTILLQQSLRIQWNTSSIIKTACNNKHKGLNHPYHRRCRSCHHHRHEQQKHSSPNSNNKNYKRNNCYNNNYCTCVAITLCTCITTTTATTKATSSNKMH